MRGIRTLQDEPYGDTYGLIWGFTFCEHPVYLIHQLLVSARDFKSTLQTSCRVTVALMIVVIHVISRESLIWFEEEHLWDSTPVVEENTYPTRRTDFSTSWTPLTQKAAF